MVSPSVVKSIHYMSGRLVVKPALFCNPSDSDSEILPMTLIAQPVL